MRGLEEPFIQLCCCVSFLFWQEIGFGFPYYSCTQSTIQLWCCVSFFGSGWKQFVVLHTYLVYNTIVQLYHFFVVAGKLIQYKFSCSIQEFSSCTQEQVLGGDGQQTENSTWTPRFSFLHENLMCFHIPDIFLVNILLLYSLSPYGHTESRTENEYTLFTWTGGTFLPVVLLCQFFVLAGNRF